MNSKRVLFVLLIAFIAMTIIDFIGYELTDTFGVDVYTVLVDNVTIVAIVGGIIYLIKFIYDYIQSKRKTP